MFSGSPNIVINIDTVEVAQPREINLEFGQNVWGGLHIETNTTETVQNGSKKNDSRVNDKYFENFHNSSATNITDEEDMKASGDDNGDEEDDNLSFFVHKLLSKRNSEEDNKIEQQNVTTHENRDSNNTDIPVEYLKLEDIEIENYELNENFTDNVTHNITDNNDNNKTISNQNIILETNDLNITHDNITEKIFHNQIYLKSNLTCRHQTIHQSP